MAVRECIAADIVELREFAETLDYADARGMVFGAIREITRLRARVEKLEGKLKAERLKPCRHTTPFEQRSERPDLHAWQTAQSEWFDPTILEIVSEYAAWRDKAALHPTDEESRDG